MRSIHSRLPLLLVFGCTCHDTTIASENKPPMPAPTLTSAPTTTPGCVDQIRALVLDGDLSSGHGLPAGGCMRADVLAVLGYGGTDGSGTLSGLTHKWLKFGYAPKDTEARVWFDGDRVILIDVKYPTVKQSPATLRKLLSDPIATLQARINVTHEEWVFPERGLTIAVGKNLDDADNAPPHISWFAAYPPTSLDDYVKHLGGKDAWVIRRPR